MHAPETLAVTISFASVVVPCQKDSIFSYGEGKEMEGDCLPRKDILVAWYLGSCDFGMAWNLYGTLLLDCRHVMSAGTLKNS